MKRIAKFEKVSYEQFKKDMLNIWSDMPDHRIRDIYDNIKLPKRATKGSAGYDFYTPFNINLLDGDGIKFPTGIRVKMEDGWVLKMYPRSGLGFKYRLQFDNTVGIIDSDYYHSDNEGHIHAKMINDNRKTKCLILDQGEAFAQGIFVEYGITEDDDVSAIRNGGFGSTSKRKGCDV
jgi:dUTP pyrophosphatase